MIFCTPTPVANRAAPLTNHPVSICLRQSTQELWAPTWPWKPLAGEPHLLMLPSQSTVWKIKQITSSPLRVACRMRCDSLSDFCFFFCHLLPFCSDPSQSTWDVISNFPPRKAHNLCVPVSFSSPHPSASFVIRPTNATQSLPHPSSFHNQIPHHTAVLFTLRSVESSFSAQPGLAPARILSWTPHNRAWLSIPSSEPYSLALPTTSSHLEGVFSSRLPPGSQNPEYAYASAATRNFKSRISHITTPAVPHRGLLAHQRFVSSSHLFRLLLPNTTSVHPQAPNYSPPWTEIRTLFLCGLLLLPFVASISVFLSVICPDTLAKTKPHPQQTSSLKFS